MPLTNPILETIYCVVCHRKTMQCNCMNQIKWFGIDAVREYNKRIKNGERFWGYQQFYNGVLGLKINDTSKGITDEDLLKTKEVKRS